ncbi:MAG: hypothetical protein CVV30_01560 [Methanomicrobiales archaeon HGW-Methanomicrobiales-1]|jgi:hypothetical protein|nr:MAG: hypothetical protein CVV30_01560 [Methanomicrobiales archaeon HGW-Methanomicrobiales-1]
MTDIESIISAEKICEAKTKESFKIPIEIYEELFTLYLNVSEKYCKNTPKAGIERPLAVLLLNDRIAKSLYCSIDLLKRGHYNECFSIQRDIFEAICLSEYILKNPKMSEVWFTGKPITFSKISKEISLLPFDQEIYGHLCDFTHPNVHSTIREYEPDTVRIGVYFTFKPYFQKEMAHSSLVHFFLLVYRAMDNYLKYMKQFHEDIEPEDSDKIEIMFKKIYKFSDSLIIKFDH